MATTNHRVKSGDLQLAMIEGTPIKTFCGDIFVPTVQVGTSGRADLPGAPNCDRCDEAIEVCRQWSRVKEEKNRLVREMRALEKLHKQLMVEYREKRENVPDPAMA